VIPTDLKFNVNGSLDLYIQNEKLGAVKVSNWLRALKNGKLGSMLRLWRTKAAGGRQKPGAHRPIKRVN
jgi:hypothetical protein